MTRASEAVQHVLDGTRFDVVLCDVQMPGMSGTELYAALQRIDAEQARRVVFVTGGPAGAPCRTLSKPVPMAMLMHVIAGFLPIQFAVCAGL